MRVSSAVKYKTQNEKIKKRERFFNPKVSSTPSVKYEGGALSLSVHVSGWCETLSVVSAIIIHTCNIESPSGARSRTIILIHSKAPPCLDDGPDTMKKYLRSKFPLLVRQKYRPESERQVERPWPQVGRNTHPDTRNFVPAYTAAGAVGWLRR